MLTTLMLGVGLLVVIMLVGVNYVVNSYGIMKLMQVEGYGDVYRAWIPFYNNYLLGEIIESELGQSQLVFPGITKWIFCLYIVAGAIPAIGELAVFVGGVYCLVVLCVFADKYKTTASMIISSIFGLSGIGMMILASRISSGQPGNPASAEKSSYEAYNSSNSSYSKKSNSSNNPNNSNNSGASNDSNDSFDEKKAKVVEFEVTKEEPAANDGPIMAKPEQKKGFVVAEPDKKTVVEETKSEQQASESGQTSDASAGEATSAAPENHEFDVPINEPENHEFDVPLGE